MAPKQQELNVPLADKKPLFIRKVALFAKAVALRVAVKLCICCSTPLSYGYGVERVYLFRVKL